MSGYCLITPWRKIHIDKVPDVIRKKGKYLPGGVWLYKTNVVLQDLSNDEFRNKMKSEWPC